MVELFHCGLKRVYVFLASVIVQVTKPYTGLYSPLGVVHGDRFGNKRDPLNK